MNRPRLPEELRRVATSMEMHGGYPRSALLMRRAAQRIETLEAQRRTRITKYFRRFRPDPHQVRHGG